MQPESWFIAMKNIMDAFLCRDFVKCLTLIRQFLSLLHLDWCKNNPLNENEYNDLLDVALLLRAFTQFPACGKNTYIQKVIYKFETAIRTYTERKNGDATQLFNAILDLQLLCDGLWVAANYLQQKGLFLDHSPIVLSFELTENASIKLFGWTDNPEIGTTEAHEEEAAIAELKTDFENLFIQKQAQKTDVLTQANLLFIQNQPEKALTLLNEAIKLDTQIQKDAFWLQAQIYEHLQQHSNLIDCLMKCFVLGTPKSMVKKRILTAAQQLLLSAQIQNDTQQLKRWQEFINDF
jgi:tetratricopeptide (TPR) repeat protein